MSTISKHDLTQGSIPRHLIRMTIPMIWGILAIISFQLVDAYYISLLGTSELAAISYTFPVTYGIFSVFIGFGVATSSVVSRMIGEKNTEDMKRVTSHSMLLVLITSIVIACIGIPLLHPLFSAMGASPSEIKMIEDFMVPYFIGTFFVSMPVVGNAVLRASGNATAPAIIMTIAAITNAAINPVLIFGLFGFPRMELMGAAIGTIFANILAMSAGLYLMHQRGMIDWGHIRNLSKLSDSAKRLLMIALPVSLTSMLPSFLNSEITHLLSRVGAEAVAAFGAASRIEAFTLIILMALSIGMAPIIGQNWGARHMDRVRDTVKFALIFVVTWSIATTLALTGFSGTLSKIFSNDVAVQNYLALYFTIIPFSYFLGNLPQIWGSAFNAIGKPKVSAKMLFTKFILISLPCVVIGFHLNGIAGLFMALAAANIISGLAYHLWAWNGMKKGGHKWMPAPHNI
jgi:putative MATE family efflux protein